MLIRINKNTSIQEIQHEFSTRFPHLKIEFFSEKTTDGKYKADHLIKDHSIKIGTIRDHGHDGVYEIDGLIPVAELEKNFFDIFGVHAQVFRKSGNTWLVTTTTDHLTLAEQNHLAVENAQSELPEKPGDAMDSLDLE
jgi:hypothetical protein